MSNADLLRRFAAALTALRDRSLLFFNYLFPLVFFFIFAQTFKAQQGGSINQVITMVLIIGAPIAALSFQPPAADQVVDLSSLIPSGERENQNGGDSDGA